MRAAWISGAAIVAVAGAFVAGRASTTHTPAAAQAAAQAAVRPAAPPRAVKADDNDAASDAAAAAASAVADVTAAAAAAQAAEAQDGGARPSVFTKATFAQWVQGKTKAQIRAAFGAPSQVAELTNLQGWYYPNLPIYDEAAGAKATVYVQFPKDADFVDSVAYY